LVVAGGSREAPASRGRGERMKVRVHLVVEWGLVDSVPARRLDLTTAFETPNPYGQEPAIGAMNAVNRLTADAIKAVSR